MAGQEALSQLFGRFEAILKPDEMTELMNAWSKSEIDTIRHRIYRRVKNDSNAKEYLDAVDAAFEAQRAYQTRTWKSQDKATVRANIALDKLTAPG